MLVDWKLCQTTGKFWPAFCLFLCDLEGKLRLNLLIICTQTTSEVTSRLFEWRPKLLNEAINQELFEINGTQVFAFLQTCELESVVKITYTCIKMKGLIVPISVIKQEFEPNRFLNVPMHNNVKFFDSVSKTAATFLDSINLTEKILSRCFTFIAEHHIKFLPEQLEIIPEN